MILLYLFTRNNLFDGPCSVIASIPNDLKLLQCNHSEQNYCGKALAKIFLYCHSFGRVES